MSVAVKNEAGPAAPSRERVELILSQLDRLPTLPPVAARLLAMATSENCGVRDLVEIIQLDPALTAGILRMIRRANLGVRQRDMTVAKAVGLMGLHAVRNAVLCSEFFEVFSVADSDDSAALRKDLWLHSVGVAAAAECIAEKTSRADLAGEIFVCGLLHDIGKIALQCSLPKSYQRVVERAQSRRVSLCDAEHEVFGLDHTVAGKRLVARWGLSPAVIEAVWLHHQDPAALPKFVTCPQIVRIVRVADEIVRSYGIGFSGSGPVDPEPGAIQLGLSAEAVSDVGGQLAARMAPLLDVLGLEAETPRLSQPLDVAHQNLRRVCADLTTQNRALAARGRLLDIIGAFTAKAASAATVAEVCAAAAGAVCAELQASGTCVFAVDRERGVVFAGWCDAGGPVQIDAFELAALRLDTQSDGRGHANAAPLAALPPHTAIWRQCFGWLPEAPLSHLPIDSGRIEAGILLARDDDRLPSIQAEPSDWAVLARTIGGALYSARARGESERATEELLDVNRRLREAQVNLLRLRSIAMVAEMAAGAAHELNNPLAVISGRAQMELAAAPEGDRRKAMEVIIAQTTKAAQIVLDLMGFAKPDPPSPILQPLSAVLDAVYQHWQGRLGEHRGKLRVRVSSTDATVYADTAQVIEAVNQVVANAVQAADSAVGRVTINSPSRPSDETVRIVVEDNGAGMSPEVLEHAVDPFFSSRPAGRGRGLGLSKAYRLVEINGGNLWIESKQGVGTTVTIELPARAQT